MGVTGIEALKKLQKKVEKLEKEDKFDMFQYLARQIALRFLSYVIPDSPVITGALRRGWIGLEGPGDDPSAADIKKYTDSIIPDRSGKRMSVTISNNVSYAPYVNYGHRQGRGWVKGQFMLEHAQKNVESVAPALLNKLSNKWLEDYFK